MSRTLVPVEQERLPCEYLAGWQVLRPASEARPRIVALRAAGYSWQRVAARLNVDAVSTPTGRGRWYPASAYRHANPVAHAAYMRDYRARRNNEAR